MTPNADIPEARTPEPIAPKKWARIPLTPVIVLVAVLAALPVLSGLFLPGPLTENKTIVIPRGAKVMEMAVSLKELGVISSPLLFRAAARGLASDHLKAGEYLFTPQHSLIDIVLMLRDGDVVLRQFTVAEGLTSAEIVDLLRDEPALTGNVAKIPDEGSVLPETYRMTYGDSRLGLIERMQKSQRDVLNSLWANRDMTLPYKTPQEAVVMASLIEKETAKSEERPRIAGVFINRLLKNMRLQSDPTVIYAITKGQRLLERELTHNDMAIASPFNTYTNDGLPPKPICNPGRASLEAALHPEAHDFLYFVADGNGGHAFAKDMAEHKKNVSKWMSLNKP